MSGEFNPGGDNVIIDLRDPAVLEVRRQQELHDQAVAEHGIFYEDVHAAINGDPFVRERIGRLKGQVAVYDMLALRYHRSTSPTNSLDYGRHIRQWQESFEGMGLSEADQLELLEELEEGVEPPSMTPEDWEEIRSDALYALARMENEIGATLPDNVGVGVAARLEPFAAANEHITNAIMFNMLGDSASPRNIALFYSNASSYLWSAQLLPEAASFEVITDIHNNAQLIIEWLENSPNLEAEQLGLRADLQGIVALASRFIDDR